MQLLNNSTYKLDVSLTREELILLNNALNEILNGIDVPEFATRIGASREEALSLLNQIKEALDV